MELLITLFVVAILYALLGALLIAVAVYYVICLVVLGIVQIVFFKLLGFAAKDDEIKAPLSWESFLVETVILILLLVGYSVLPADPIRIDPAACSVVYDMNRSHEYETTEPKFTHPESIELIVQALDGLELNHTLPTTIKYGYANLKEESRVRYIFFFDENDGLVQGLAFHGNIVGVLNELDGKFKWYNTKEELSIPDLFKDAFRTERELNARDQYGDTVQLLRDSFTVENGRYTFTMPDFGEGTVNLKISGSQEVFTSMVVRSTGYEMSHSVKQDTIYYLTEHTEAADWQAGETYTFTLDDTTFSSVWFVVMAGGFEFDLELPLEDAYRSDRDNPIVTYIG